ncbi:MAG: hypothetical protein R3E52_03270 [Burkholderiaceae bacterium]
MLTLLREQVEKYTPEHVAETVWIEPRLIDEFNAQFMHAPKLATRMDRRRSAHQRNPDRACDCDSVRLTGACDKEGGNNGRTRPYRDVNDYQSFAETADKALGLKDLPLGPPNGVDYGTRPLESRSGRPAIQGRGC